MVCKNCNQETDNHFGFCPNCGNPLQQNETTNIDSNESVNILHVVGEVGKIAKTVWMNPEVQEIVDEVKEIVGKSVEDKKKQVLRDFSKKVKKETIKTMKKIGLKDKNIVDRVCEKFKKQ